MKKSLLSLFGGTNIDIQVLKDLGVKIDNHLVSEVNPFAIRVSNHNHPDAIHVGDIRDIKIKNGKINHYGDLYGNFKLIIGGSPCQSFSFAGRRKGMSVKDGEVVVEIKTLQEYLKYKKEGFQFIGHSYLFWEFVLLIKTLKPKYFLLENVVMDKKWEAIITKALGVEPIRINSGTLTAQNRDRLYWTNIPGVLQPKNLNITDEDVIPGHKSWSRHGVLNPDYIEGITLDEKKYGAYRINIGKGKFNTLTTTRSKVINTKTNVVRFLTVTEAEKLQGFPTGYMNIPGISDTQKFKMLGNAMTYPVLKHILKGIKK
jgi:site-specific DNA-cytosine methylase